jgi:hypothetical protein
MNRRELLKTLGVLALAAPMLSAAELDEPVKLLAGESIFKGGRGRYKNVVFQEGRLRSLTTLGIGTTMDVGAVVLQHNGKDVMQFPVLTNGGHADFYPFPDFDVPVSGVLSNHPDVAWTVQVETPEGLLIVSNFMEQIEFKRVSGTYPAFRQQIQYTEM